MDETQEHTPVPSPGADDRQADAVTGTATPVPGSAAPVPVRKSRRIPVAIAVAVLILAAAVSPWLKPDRTAPETKTPAPTKTSSDDTGTIGPETRQAAVLVKKSNPTLPLVDLDMEVRKSYFDIAFWGNVVATMDDKFLVFTSATDATKRVIPLAGLNVEFFACGGGKCTMNNIPAIGVVGNRLYVWQPNVLRNGADRYAGGDNTLFVFDSPTASPSSIHLPNRPITVSGTDIVTDGAIVTVGATLDVRDAGSVTGRYIGTDKRNRLLFAGIKKDPNYTGWVGGITAVTPGNWNAPVQVVSPQTIGASTYSLDSVKYYPRTDTLYMAGENIALADAATGTLRTVAYPGGFTGKRDDGSPMNARADITGDTQYCIGFDYDTGEHRYAYHTDTGILDTACPRDPAASASSDLDRKLSGLSIPDGYEIRHMGVTRTVYRYGARQDIYAEYLPFEPTPTGVRTRTK